MLPIPDHQSASFFVFDITFCDLQNLHFCIDNLRTEVCRCSIPPSPEWLHML